jgi:hypothetical protein
MHGFIRDSFLTTVLALFALISRSLGAFVFYNLLKYIMQDSLRVIGLRYELADPEYIPALLDIVFNIIIVAFVG